MSQRVFLSVTNILASNYCQINSQCFTMLKMFFNSTTNCNLTTDHYLGSKKKNHRRQRLNEIVWHNTIFFQHFFIAGYGINESFNKVLSHAWAIRLHLTGLSVPLLQDLATAWFYQCVSSPAGWEEWRDDNQCVYEPGEKHTPFIFLHRFALFLFCLNSLVTLYN